MAALANAGHVLTAFGMLLSGVLALGLTLWAGQALQHSWLHNHTALVSPSAAALAASLAWLPHRRIQRWHEANVASLRRVVRNVLLDRGLLALALEPDPFDRLPALGKVPLKHDILQLFVKREKHQSGKAEYRLMDLASSYKNCCENLKLDPYPLRLDHLDNLRGVAAFGTFLLVLWGPSPWFKLLGVFSMLLFGAISSYLETITLRIAQLEIAEILLGTND
jgi:hypothetical protein